jgi:carboxylesterase
MKVLMERGEPFFFPEGPIGCLLVHGFTGSPWEMRWLGQVLAKSGYTTLGIRLFGHSTKREDLTRVRWWDWYLSALDGYHLLKNQCDHVFFIGQSLGGALCMLLGSQQPCAGIVTLAAPYFLPEMRVAKIRPVLPLLSRVWRFAAKDPATDWVDQDAKQRNVEYDAHPVRGGMEVYDLLAVMRSYLHRIESPTLMIYSRGDGTLVPDHADDYQKALGMDRTQVQWLEGSGHNIASDAARGEVFNRIQDFIQDTMRVIP